ncbi:hydroxypyruvate isomerase family protein [Pseudomonas sp. TYF_14]|uniref:hydroxypyruvate isomerase family protein n=1 Tax=Pseudomonas sp. TYF_14 TaxID=3367193 RepID=UPI00370CD34C
MLKFNAHLGFQFTELPFLDRFSAAAEAGFAAVEFPSPYEYDASVLADLLQASGLELIQIASPSGDSKGLAAVPGKAKEFRHGLEKAVQYATALGCTNVHLMSGVTGDGQASAVFRENLDYGVNYLLDRGLVPLVEVISVQAAPGYFFSDFHKAQDVLDRLPGLRLILDLYHAQILTQDAIGILRAYHHRIEHVQIADWPGRNEPGSGSMDFLSLFNMLQQLGYSGWVGCEYHPSTVTTDTLGWMSQFKSDL